MKFDHTFYERPVVEVAKALIGKKLVCGPHQGIITETEAYRGQDDEASHAFRGKTPRSSIMFGPSGFAYVYFIYGMYYCLNITAEAAGQPAAVLIRGLHLPHLHLNGPGKICRHLGITTKDNGINVIQSDHLYITQGIPINNILTTPRIGIGKAINHPWRFVASMPT